MKNQDTLLIEWYKKNNFDLPWRVNQNPYRIWISEIMLQQTQVNTVITYYAHWMKNFQTIDLVAQSNIDIILKYWEGLGYYQRAHNIHKASKKIVSEFKGVVPESYDDLITLNGIGDYTASAILSIAFEKPYPAIDGNIKRIISRILASHNVDKLSKKVVLSYMHKYNPGDINQALMDLGRTVCTPKAPKCIICPIQKFCKAYKLKIIHKFPEKKNKRNNPTYDVIVGIIWKNNKMLISKRKKNGLLGGLWELPGGKKKKHESNKQCLEREIREELNINIDVADKIDTIHHKYSHFNIKLTAYHCNYKTGIPKAICAEKIQWIKYKEIKKFAFPKSTLKILKLNDLYCS